MSNLAQRIRDIRYKKGLGPDALAARAEISRTALYQIECGKTEVPRAGTLRRIAEALDVPIDQLLGYWPKAENLNGFELPEINNALDHQASISMETEWSYPDDPEITAYPDAKRTFDSSSNRDEVIRQLENLLDSRFGDSISRIIRETHTVMQASRTSQAVSRPVSLAHARNGR